MCDRTLEFTQCVNKVSSSSSAAPKKLPPAPQTRTDFNEAASEIARGVHKTSTRLTQLTNLVRRQGLFDDPTEDINKLILSIKKDLDELNGKCDSAQQYVDSKKSIFGGVDQSSAHNVKVVSHLKTDLMHTTKDFKQVLELRSSKMKDQQQRKVELTGKGILSPLKSLAAQQERERKAQQQQQQQAAPNNSSSSSSSASQELTKKQSFTNKQLPTPYGPSSYSHMDTSSNGGTGLSHRNVAQPYDFNMQQQQQQQFLLDPIAETQYFDAREKAVTEVEKTIGELGQLFNRLSTMIAAQAELVERIDDDVENAVANTNRAQDALMQAYANVSSNTGMYTKIGVIMAIFLLIFVLFLM